MRNGNRTPDRIALIQVKNQRYCRKICFFELVHLVGLQKIDFQGLSDYIDAVVR